MPQTRFNSAIAGPEASAGKRSRKALIDSGRASAGLILAPRRRIPLAIAFPMLTFLALATVRPAHAQDERRSKVPVIGKIAGGSTRQAFSGKVQSLDLKRRLLTVGTVEGSATEFFPVKKDVPVETAGGEKLKVKELSPGTNVIVYYEVKNDRRSVSEIVVLGPGGDEKQTGAKDKDTKKPTPPS